MEKFLLFMQQIIEFMQHPINLYGYEVSMWGVFLFVCLGYLVFWFIGGLFDF